MRRTTANRLLSKHALWHTHVLLLHAIHLPLLTVTTVFITFDGGTPALFNIIFHFNS